MSSGCFEEDERSVQKDGRGGPSVRRARNRSWDPRVVLEEARRPGRGEACSGGSETWLQVTLTQGRGFGQPAAFLGPGTGSRLWV